MTGPDDLRARLRAADPMRHPGASPADLPADRLDALLEAAMTDTRTTPVTAADATRRTPRWAVLAAAAAAVGIVVVGTAVGVTVLGDDDVAPAGPAAVPTVLEVEAGPDDALASCAMFDPAVLAAMPAAYDATATEVGDGAATLEVERTYAGEDVDRLVIRTPDPQLQALVAGLGEVAVGERYLVSIDGGTVTSCGYSGPWSPESAAVWDEAFRG